MSEIKHTPGPWWASGLEVGTVPMMDIKVARVSGATFEEAKANARLIAATPFLLQALRGCCEHMEWSTPQGREAYEDAQAAIRNATGSQS